ncbi:uncharacterized protein FTOL_01581 [Fusarium torulosum]|uniref:Uncharacterized protein n=1 Tax=Fusarium torulosum TaxID=33205 RepID=A0AAE8M0L3_9HYPO|nr:uncharacterized protein FTOL_01581 [Fusarium torulosum]
MEPLTIDDLACLIEQKPTTHILVKIDRCKIDEFQDLMGDCIYGKFLHQVVGLKRVTSVGMELKATQEWARQTISTIAASEREESSDDEGQNEDEASEAGPTFHRGDLIAL